ncbi:VpaChn25_0724 family phage protein [Sneathiella sp.]|uniref:VpaChn25_0724 family phage protein n=1 Tax=Sneathiella sp. TaxID=1964365 RepID=UPI002FE072B5
MTDYNEFLRRHRRLTILRILDEAPGYSANESLLHQVVVSFGDKASRDQIRTEIVWLEEQGLLRTKRIADLYVAEIVKRGSEVAKGLAVVPGVQQPSPED